MRPEGLKRKEIRLRDEFRTTARPSPLSFSVYESRIAALLVISRRFDEESLTLGRRRRRDVSGFAATSLPLWMAF